MILATNLTALRQALNTLPQPIGLVPTMGYLHEGHLSLLRRARTENATVVMSLFVNPTQFGPGEDFERYPRDPERDAALAQEAGVDILFAPSVEEIYPQGFSTYVEVQELTRNWEGQSRPGHFRGVATVVLKLFNLVNPDKAYFGEKDYQQLKVVQKMVRDLNLEVQIVPCPTVREPDGLAMSSRNAYLKGPDRTSATALSRALFRAQDLVRRGTLDSAEILQEIAQILRAEPHVRVDYLAIVDSESLEPVEQITGEARALIAAYVGDVRLIDNIALRASSAP